MKDTTAVNALADLEKEINAAMEKDLPGARLKHETIPAQRTPRQQLDAFLASSDKMLEMQRRDLIRSESAYQLERVRILDDFRVRIEQLRNECADAVRALDLQHKRDLEAARSLLDRLAAMRSLD